MKNLIPIFLFLFISNLIFAQNSEVIREKSKYDTRVTIEKSLKSTYYYYIDTVFLPDGSGTSYTATITVDQFALGQTITNVNQILGVCARMEHSYLGDLTFTLASPSGDTVTFIQYPSSCGATYLGVPIDDDNDLSPGIGFDYCFTNGPYLTWTDSCGVGTLPPGNYQPQSSWSNLLGSELNGDWTITVTDNLMSDNGFIFGWSLGFDLDLVNLTRVEGLVYSDVNENCAFDAGDYPMEGVWLEFNPGPYYAITNENGEYAVYVDAGTYEISQVLPNALFTLNCPVAQTYTVNVLQVGDTLSGFNFGYTADVYCPQMHVDIGTWAIRPCQPSHFTVQYSNQGTILATNATIEVELDPALTYMLMYGNATLLSQNGNLLTFDVGNVGPGMNGQFTFVADVDCNLDLVGSTLCTEAHIFPDDPCFAPDPAWDHSSVSVEGYCSDSTACFIIENTGDPGGGDMLTSSEYRIYENNNLVYTGTFQINGGSNIEICWPANGNTIRLEADQHPMHPGNSHPQDIVENCGNYFNVFVTGLVNSVPQDDLDHFVEIECIEVTASLDPNDKRVVPSGITEQYHYIDTSDVLEYFIRFQNTGTDTAFDVYILDTISEFLMVSSIEPGVSSHPYHIEVLTSDVIRFVFNDILLPDSTTNEPGSNGFVKFNIRQKPGNPKGTQITNKAGIIFDFNLPVITNTVFNTIGSGNEIVSIPPVAYQDEISVSVAPNPFSNEATFVMSDVNQVYEFRMVDLMGKEVCSISEIEGGQFVINRNNLQCGVYFYSITSPSGMVCTGKLAIK